MKMKRRCSICGKGVDDQGWCGSSTHDAGNPYVSFGLVDMTEEMEKHKADRERLLPRSGK